MYAMFLTQVQDLEGKSLSVLQDEIIEKCLRTLYMALFSETKHCTVCTLLNDMNSSIQIIIPVYNSGHR